MASNPVAYFAGTSEEEALRLRHRTLQDAHAIYRGAKGTSYPSTYVGTLTTFDLTVAKQLQIGKSSAEIDFECLQLMHALFRQALSVPLQGVMSCMQPYREAAAKLKPHIIQGKGYPDPGRISAVLADMGRRRQDLQNELQNFSAQTATDMWNGHFEEHRRLFDDCNNLLKRMSDAIVFSKDQSTARQNVRVAILAIVFGLIGSAAGAPLWEYGKAKIFPVEAKEKADVPPGRQ